MKHLVITICCAFVLAIAGGIATGSHQAAYAGNPNCVSPAYGCASSLTVTAPAESDAPGCAWSFGYYKIKFTAVACATNYLPDTMTATRAHVGGAFEHVTLTRIGSTSNYAGYTDCVIGPNSGHDYYGSTWMLSANGTTVNSFCARLVCCDGSSE